MIESGETHARGARKVTHRDLADFTANMATAQLEVGDLPSLVRFAIRHGVIKA